MLETTYSAQSPLSTPRRFARDLRDDLRIVAHVGWRLFRRNLRVQVRQNLLGYVWMLLPALVSGLVWIYLGRVRILNWQESTLPYPVFVLTGLFLWQGFVEALNCPLQHLQSARSTLTKVRVPHEAFVLAGFGTVLLNMAIRLLILGGVMLWFGIPWHPTLLYVPIGLAMLLLFGLALGWLLAPVGLLYADIANALPVVLNLWFLLTPVVYTAPASVARFLTLNPITPLLTTTRNWLLTGQGAPAPHFGLIACAAVGLFVLSWLTYRLAQPHLIVRL